VTGISIDPTNPKAITASVSYDDTRYFVDSPHVAQYSYTGSASSGSWTVITGNLPTDGAVSRVVYDNGALVAATDAGVYGTGTVAGSSTAWSLIGTGLPAVQTQDLYVDPGTNALYAVTHGRGAWILPSSNVAFHIVTTSVPPATRGVAYSVQLQAAGGTPPYKWKKLSGSLPKGLKVSSTGLLSGTPSLKAAAGAYNFVVQAKTHKSKGNPSQVATQPLTLNLS
jgi:hypothetical protein